MKNSKFILGVVSIMTLCLTACGKPNMTFEEAVDSVTHSELSEIMANAEFYEQNFDISTSFSIPESIIDDNIEGKISLSTHSKQNTKDSEGESNLSLKLDISGDGDEGRETIKVDGDAMMKYLSNAVFFKLNSLNISGPEDFTDEFDFDLSGIKDQWFSFEITEEMLEKINAELPEDFDLEKMYNEEDLQKLAAELKKAITNEGAVVYSGIYSEFDGYNAYRFGIDRERVFNASTEYIKTLIPEEYMDEYLEAIEDVDLDEIFEDFPLKNFEGYLVITGKDRVQIVIENIDIEDSYLTTKMHGTFGRDRYELSVQEDGEEVFLFSAQLKRAHYDVLLKVGDMEIIKGTITPKLSHGKISVDFDLSINIELDEKIIIPLKGGWDWKEISKFNVERPANSKNLLEDIMENMDPESLQSLQLMMGEMGGQNVSTPALAGGILTASLAPRMESAQGRARDVARKNDLSQIQTAIITSQQDKGMWPGIFSGSIKGITTSTIEDDLIHAGMYQVPTDPDINNINYGLGENYKNKVAKGEYLYLTTKRNGVQNGGFALMTKTEEEESSNWVVCKNGTGLNKGYITNDTDIARISKCTDIMKGDTCSNRAGTCTYTDEEELRYILLY